MKKAVILLAVTVITVCLFASCSSKNSGSGDNYTTAVTDTNGETHYYEVVTDENGETVTDENGSTVYAEIVTNKNGQAETDKNKSYVTKESSTALYNSKNDVTTSETNSADNEVPFNQPNETTTYTTQTTNTADTTVTTTTEETTTQSVTDKDGWINKWY